MFWFDGTAYATLWDVRRFSDESNNLAVNFSTSEKKQDGSYVSSSWNGVAFGDSAKFIEKLEKGDRFIINRAKIEVRPYEKDGKKFFPTSVTLVDISEVSSDKPSKNAPKNNGGKKATKPSVDIENEEEAPW